MVPPWSSATLSASSTVEARWATTMPVASAQHPAQRLLDELLGVHVERGQGVVEDQDPRAGQHRAGQGEPLALAAGQRHPLLADAGVEPPRQVVHELRLGDLEGLVEHLVLAGSRRRCRPSRRFSRALIENSVGSSKAVATIRRRFGQLEVAYVDPVDGDPARR